MGLWLPPESIPGKSVLDRHPHDDLHDVEDLRRQHRTVDALIAISALRKRLLTTQTSHPARGWSRRLYGMGKNVDLALKARIEDRLGLAAELQGADVNI